MSKASPSTNDPTGADIRVARSDDERAIRALIGRWVTAIRAHDLDAIANDRTSEIVMFDVPEPLQLKGMKQYLDSWRLYFKFDGSKEFQLQELKVFAGTDVAWAHSVLRCEGVPEATARLTLGFVKQDDVWKVAHEHHSGPMKAENGQIDKD